MKQTDKNMGTMAHETKNPNGVLDNVSVSSVKNFLKWLDNQPKDYMCGSFKYSTTEYGNRDMNQEKMFDYWLVNVYSH